MAEKREQNGRYLSERDLAELKAKLGLPDHVIDYLRQQPRLSALVNGTGAALLIVLMLAVGFLPMLTLSPAFGRLLLDIGYLPQDTMLINLNFFSIVPAAFAGFFWAGFLVCVAARLNPDIHMKSIANSLYQTIQPGQKYSGIGIAIARWLKKDLCRDVPAKVYLQQIDRRQTRVFWKGGLTLYLITLPLLALDLRSAERVTPDGLVITPFFSSKTLYYDWTDVVRVRTGCRTSYGRSTSYDLQYVLTMADGRKVNPAFYKSLRVPMIDALESIERELSARRVPKTRGKFDQGCLNAKRGEFGNRGFERLQRIL